MVLAAFKHRIRLILVPARALDTIRGIDKCVGRIHTVRTVLPVVYKFMWIVFLMQVAYSNEVDWREWGEWEV